MKKKSCDSYINLDTGNFRIGSYNDSYMDNDAIYVKKISTFGICKKILFGKGDFFNNVISIIRWLNLPKLKVK